MAIAGKIVDFFLDKTKSIVGFPRTKVKAVSDDNNVSLDVLLGNINTSVDNAMPKSGGTFTGLVTFGEGNRIVAENTEHKLALAAGNDAVYMQLLDKNGNHIGLPFALYKDGSFFSDYFMLKSGGTFQGAVLADSGIRAGDYLRNICIKESSGNTNVATMAVYFRRK